jgi:hypothetical protein
LGTDEERMAGLFRAKKPKFDDPEMHKKLTKFQESLAHQLQSGGEKAVTELKTRFDAHDGDGSGSLSEKEFIKAMKEFGKASHLVDEESKKKFSSKDWKLIFLFMDSGEKTQGPDGKDLAPEIECVCSALSYARARSCAPLPPPPRLARFARGRYSHTHPSPTPPR